MIFDYYGLAITLLEAIISLAFSPFDLTFPLLVALVSVSFSLSFALPPSLAMFPFLACSRATIFPLLYNVLDSFPGEKEEENIPLSLPSVIYRPLPLCLRRICPGKLAGERRERGGKKSSSSFEFALHLRRQKKEMRMTWNRNKFLLFISSALRQRE